jgi:hypothetical protein
MKKPFNRFIICIIDIICMPFLLFAAEYNPSEMFIISWGDGSSQLKIDLPFHEDVYNTPEDSSDD